MFDNRLMLTRLSAAAALAALVAGAITFGPGIRGDANVVTFERPTSELKGDRLDIKPVPLREERTRRCEEDNWANSPSGCLHGKPREILIVAISRIGT